MDFHHTKPNHIFSAWIFTSFQAIITVWVWWYSVELIARTYVRKWRLITVRAHASRINLCHVCFTLKWEIKAFELFMWKSHIDNKQWIHAEIKSYVLYALQICNKFAIKILRINPIILRRIFKVVTLLTLSISSQFHPKTLYDVWRMINLCVNVYACLVWCHIAIFIKHTVLINWAR